MSKEKIERIQKIDRTRICGYFGEYRYLSNFHICPVKYEGVVYVSSENAYMAAKTLDLELRKEFETISPALARKLGQEIELRPNWENIKIGIMHSINYIKFRDNKDIQEKLISTEYKYLEESNWWRDKFWGVYIDELGVPHGENNLGKIHMKVRENFRFEKMMAEMWK